MEWTVRDGQYHHPHRLRLTAWKYSCSMRSTPEHLLRRVIQPHKFRSLCLHWFIENLGSQWTLRLKLTPIVSSQANSYTEHLLALPANCYPFDLWSFPDCPQFRIWDDAGILVGAKCRSPFHQSDRETASNLLLALERLCRSCNTAG